MMPISASMLMMWLATSRLSYCLREKNRWGWSLAIWGSSSGSRYWEGTVEAAISSVPRMSVAQLLTDKMALSRIFSISLAYS